MTIQPNNQAPKFQDPSETPDRTPESRKADVVPEKADRREDKPVAKHAADHRSTESDVRTSPSEDKTPADRKSTEDHVRAEKKSPEDEASAVKNDAAVSKNDLASKNDVAGTKTGTPVVKKDNEAAAAQKAPQNQAPVAARTRLFEEKEVTQFREQWRELQAGFVDEPRGAVREADTLVSQMMDTLTSQLAEQKRSLQGESDAVDTEQLRVALQRYRSLFDQMLQV